MTPPVHVAIEAGARRVFAIAVDYPGWARADRNEDAALARLEAYRGRYQGATGIRIPSGVTVTERLRGDATTDFGAPSQALSEDDAPLTGKTCTRWLAILASVWATFDSIAAETGDQPLALGPRGGGRTCAAIVTHVLDAEQAYLAKLGGEIPPEPTAGTVRASFLRAIEGRTDGSISDRGPRGGVRWSPRVAIRRSAWHALDHAWEIEDRR